MVEMTEKSVSRTIFLVGLILAILVSSIVSVALSIHLAVGPQGPEGPQGMKGDKGDVGATGPQGPAGVFTVTNMSGYVSAPAYDSGWVHTTAAGNYSFSHNLGTVEVFVDVRFNDYRGIEGATRRILWFNLTNNEVWIRTWAGDYVFVNATYLQDVYLPLDIRVMIWKIASP